MKSTLKHTIIFSLLMAVCLPGLAQDVEYAITVPATNSTVILAPRSSRIMADKGWLATNAVTQGQILYAVTPSAYYMVLVAGTTATSSPTNTIGQVEVNGTATLINCQLTGRREKALVTQEANAAVWYQTGKTATTNGGEYAFLKGQQYSTDETGAVSVFSTEGVKLNIKDK